MPDRYTQIFFISKQYIREKQAKSPQTTNNITSKRTFIANFYFIF